MTYDSWKLECPEDEQDRNDARQWAWMKRMGFDLPKPGDPIEEHINVIPGKDPALATAYKHYSDIRAIADRIAEDDPDWIYTVVKRADGQYVIAVHEDAGDDEEVFLGFL
jgi:hypothetical protein